MGKTSRRSPAQRYRSVADKIGRAYEAGDFDKAERWDARLENWEDAKDAHLNEHAEDVDPTADMEPETGDDTGFSGLGEYAAARHQDLLDAANGYGPFQGGTPADVASNIRSQGQMSLGNEGGFAPATRNPTDEELLQFAAEQYRRRQALLARYRSPDKIVSPGLSELLGRISPEQAGAILGGLLTGASQAPMDDPYGLRSGLLMGTY